MSLDISIKANIPVVKNGTGIFIRENGKTKELTIEEANANGFNVNDNQYVSEYAWTGNITHNLGKMASNVKPDGKPYTLYSLLWGGKYKNCRDLIGKLHACILYMMMNKEELKKYNPENGWGTYEQLLEFTKEFQMACIDNQDCKIKIYK